jgi:hypothetical protein
VGEAGVRVGVVVTVDRAVDTGVAEGEGTGLAVCGLAVGDGVGEGICVGNGTALTTTGVVMCAVAAG